jgi:serine/threonine protein kinase
MRVVESPSPNPPEVSPMPPTTQSFNASKYQSRLLNSQSAAGVESVLAAACAAMGFDIAEIWLRTGPKTHQLINSHLRSTALDETLRDQLVEVYYGDKAAERTHRLSPALCKKAKEDNDVVWVTAQTETGAKALKCSLNGVLTAVAVPVCHEATNSNMTIIYFSVKRATMRPEAIEFLIHMSLAAAVAGVNDFDVDDDEPGRPSSMGMPFEYQRTMRDTPSPGISSGNRLLTRTTGNVEPSEVNHLSHHPKQKNKIDGGHGVLMDTSRGIRPVPSDDTSVLSGISRTGANLDLRWADMRNVEYLTDGGNNWIHTAVMNKTPVVIKQLKPEVRDVSVAITEIEDELKVHAMLNHENIVRLFGAGYQSDHSRFLVMERLDGGTLTQLLGYETRIRDRRRRFWKKQKLPYVKVLGIAKQIAEAMDYCHRMALPGSMILHRDLKPDNIGLTLGGEVKIIDFGLARVVDNASPDMDELYEMSGETGSLRYMAPEVASSKPYNQKADVYSFGMILWELVAYEKPFNGMNREEYYDKVVHSGFRPEITKKFPEQLADLIQRCWNTDPQIRPNFDRIADLIDEMLENENNGKSERRRIHFSFKRDSNRDSTRGGTPKLKDRHSTWF